MGQNGGGEVILYRPGDICISAETNKEILANQMYVVATEDAEYTPGRIRIGHTDFRQVHPKTETTMMVVK